MGNRSRSRSSSHSTRSPSRSVSRERKRKSRSRSTYSRSPSPNNCKRLHIANLDDSVRRRDIEDAFGKYGKLSDVWVASYPPFYAFVVYEKSEEANDALKDMRSGYVRNCHIRTTVALPRHFSRRGPPPRGRFGGGYGGGGYDRFDDRDRFRRGGGGRSRSRSPRRRRRSPSRSRSPKRSVRRNRSASRSVSR